MPLSVCSLLSLFLVSVASSCLFSVMHLKHSSRQADKGISTRFFCFRVCFCSVWLCVRMVWFILLVSVRQSHCTEFFVLASCLVFYIHFNECISHLNTFTDLSLLLILHLIRTIKTYWQTHYRFLAFKAPGLVLVF